MVDQGDGGAGNLQVFHRGRHEGLQGGDPLRIQAMRRPAREALAVLARRLQRAHEQIGARAALLESGLVGVDQHHGPVRAFPGSDCGHGAMLVGRDVVGNLGPRVPELPRRQGGREQHLAGHAAGPEHRPGLGGGLWTILGLARIDDDDVGIAFRRAHIHEAGPAFRRPVLRQGEADPERRDLWRIGRRRQGWPGGRGRRRRGRALGLSSAAPGAHGRRRSQDSQPSVGTTHSCLPENRLRDL